MKKVLSWAFAIYLMLRYGINGAQEYLARENKRLERKIKWYEKWS